MTEKQERQLLAMIGILTDPDPPDLVGIYGQKRGRNYTYARDPLRDRDALKRDLATAYVAWRRQERCTGHDDISCVVSFRRQPLLKMKRQA